MDPRLVILCGPLAGQIVSLDIEPFTIGRHASNRLVIREVAVSRHHATVAREEDGFVLRDLDSRHGTSVNGVGTTKQRLAHGDLITVCGSTFLFFMHEIEDSSAAAEAVRFDENLFVGTSTVALEASGLHVLQAEEVIAALPAGERGALKLGALLRTGADLPAVSTIEELAELLLRRALEAVPAARAALLLATPDGDAFDPVFAREHDATTQQAMPISRTVTLRVLKQKVALMSNDVRQAEDLEGVGSLMAAKVGALICVPLMTSAPQPLGVLYFDDDRDGDGFHPDDLRLATALAGMAAPVIANLRHLEWVEGERQRLQAADLDHEMVGTSEAMARALRMIARVARTDSTVLLRGESGTGKELAAQAVHRSSARRERPFVAINCAILEGSLLESDLFGHEKGAFTGAIVRKIGKLEIAHTGSLFLDEVGELPLTTQAKLLRVLQEREFERVGGTRPIKTDVRVIAATNRDLEAAIKAGTFRQDLFYRLDVVSVTLPPLRQRRSDVPLLAGHFAARHAVQLKRSVPSFSPAARRALERYAWPGNVRELSNAIERALVLCPDDVIHPEDLPESLLETANPAGDEEGTANTYQGGLRDAKKQLIKTAVRGAQGNITQAARALDLHPNYLHRLIKNLDLRGELL